MRAFPELANVGGHAAGLYPKVHEYSASIQPASIDSLEPAYPCPLADRLRREMERSPEWLAHLARSQATRDIFNDITGIEEQDIAGWKESWDQ